MHYMFADECRRRGAFVSGDPLKPVATATTVRVRDGKALLTDDGPPPAHPAAAWRWRECPGYGSAMGVQSFG